jgi:acetyltransferase-like isoleucine patch superfamily enzyme
VSGADGGPRQARFLTWASLRWMVRHRAYTPWYLVRYWRFFVFKLRNPHVITEGFVFLGKNVELYARKGYGRLVIGRWVHIGQGNAIRCHEGTLRIGDKCVFGKDNTVNCYLDIEFGAATIVADWVYICDFDHVFSDITVPIKDQGIAKTPVRVGPDVWVGAKVTILRGVNVGRGCVLAAHTVVNKDLPDYRSACRPGWCATGSRTTTPTPPGGPRWPTSRARPARPPSRPGSPALTCPP